MTELYSGGDKGRQEERVLTVLKAVAGMELTWEDNNDYSCVFCSFTTENKPNIEENEIPHEANCPVVLAQSALAEMGIPLNVFKVVVDAPLAFGVRRLIATYVMAFTEDAARAKYIDMHPYHDIENITFVRKVKL